MSFVLKEVFIELLRSYSSDPNSILELWHEVEVNYSKKNRHYHNLAHLDHLLIQLNRVRPEIKDWETVLFTLFYHDIIYNALKKNNEKKSAEFAATRMKSLGIENCMIESCRNQILATQKHSPSAEHDTNLFLDADLSILGQNWEDYLVYAKNIRKEYSIYPDLIYNAGRRKMLTHFLQMERIFKTPYFFSNFEQLAKQNIQKELEIL